jgi:Nuclease-related domain
MGTPAVSTLTRQAGEHAQVTADRLRRRTFLAVLASLTITVLAFLVLGGHGPALIAVELVALAVILLVPRWIEPDADKWARGAQGERHVGAILEDLGPDWHALHDVSLGRGNIDHVLVGPGGTFTVETKSHRGHIAVERIDEAMLRQAYAERKLLEKISGLEAEPLLVFSRAWLVGSLPAHRRGVTVLPARMLTGYLIRRRPKLRSDEVTEIAERLRLALEVDAGAH